MSGAARERGTVEAIFAGAEPEAVPAALEQAEVVAGRGIRGDRYFEGERHLLASRRRAVAT